MKRRGAFWLPDRDTHFARRSCGVYQLGQQHAAVKRCRRRRCAIDVGAHVGIWTRRLAELFDHVIAFEPWPENRECLVRNVHGLRNVRVVPWALGASHVEGVGMRAGSPGNSGVMILEEGTRGNVRVMAMDAFGFSDVDLIKIDVEGAERGVLSGAEETIRECRPVVVVEDSGDARSVLVGWGYRQVARFNRDHVLVPDDEGMGEAGGCR